MSRFRLLEYKPSRIVSYGIVLFSIALALAVSLWAYAHLGVSPGSFFICAVMLSAWFGGVGPALLAAALATLCFHYYFLPPTHILALRSAELPKLFPFMLTTVLVGLLSAAQRSAKESVRRTRDDLTETVKHLQRTNDALLVQSREREQAENRLRRNEAYLAEAQRTSRTGSFGWDVAGGEIYWSRETFRIFELEPTGKVTSDLILQRTHPEDRAEVEQLIERVTRQRTAFEFEHRLLMLDGSVKYVHVAGRPSENERGHLEFVGAVTDVSERKRAEEDRERLRQAQADLAHMNRVSMMGELAAAMAHEIKQPIAAVVLNANTSLRWLARDKPDLQEAREAIMRAVKDATRATEIINRLRCFYTKGAPPQPELVDLNEVAREMLTLLHDEAIRYRAVMRTELAPDLPSVRIDRVQLQQVFMNLMLNAIEAMKEAGGELAVRSQLSDHSQLLISVSDTGVGLPAEKPEQIFDAFFTTKSQGTGMGLAITRSIIEANRGRLWASANPGAGATFRFTLPGESAESSTSAD